MQQTIEKTGIDPARILKIWHTKLDGREREHHKGRWPSRALSGPVHRWQFAPRATPRLVRRSGTPSRVVIFEILADADAVAARLKAQG